MAKNTWLGSQKLTLSPDSPEVDTQADGITTTLKYEGPYAECLSAKPARLTTIPGYGEARVVSTRCAKLPGRRGTLTIRLFESKVQPAPPSESGEGGDDGGGGPPGLGDIVIELDWVRIDKPIETHPLFADISAEVLETIRQAIQNPTGSAPEIPAGTAAALLFAKMARGQESYPVFAPVVTRERKYYSRPGSTTVGQRDNPPVSVPGDWEFVKTADRLRRERGIWTRNEEWTGADEWDPDIFP